MEEKDNMNCAYCNKEFTPNRYTQRFCSKTCQDKAWSKHIQKVGVKSYTYTCLYCGKDYHPKAKDRNIYCSRECRYKHQKEQAKGSYRSINGYHIGWHNTVYFPVCTICGKSFTAKSKQSKCCSEECKQQLYLTNQRDKYREVNGIIEISKLCPECGNTFITYDSKKVYCSEFCCVKVHRRIRRSTERARLRNARVESFNPNVVFERDKWKCRICGIKTPKKHRGTLLNNAPELDHIIPLSLGGEHSKRNTQCVCRQCNINKSNGYVDGGEQLFLFG